MANSTLPKLNADDPMAGMAHSEVHYFNRQAKSQFGTELVANIANIHIATTIMVSFAEQMIVLVYKH